MTNMGCSAESVKLEHCFAEEIKVQRSQGVKYLEKTLVTLIPTLILTLILTLSKNPLTNL